MSRYTYSPTETKLLKMIPHGPNKSIDSVALANALYKGLDMPFYGKVYVNTTMRHLIEKVKANREPFKVMSSKTRPIEFWLTGK